MSDLEWGKLQSFLAVARAGRLTLAARRLGIDHSTLSRRIDSLEQTLQARLFDRSATGYVLTAQGERLLQHAEHMESVALDMQTEISGSSQRVAGTVRIGAPDGLGTFFLAPLLAQLAAQHPQLEIQLVTLPRAFSLSKREADLAIGLARPDEGRLHARKLTDYDLGLYASTSYLAAHTPPRDVGELGQHRFIGYVSDLIYMPELDYLPMLSNDIHPGFTSSSLVAQFTATQAGHGLCLLPCFMADGDPQLRRVLPDEVTLQRSFWLIVHADMRNQARVALVAEFVAENLRANAARFRSK